MKFAKKMLKNPPYMRLVFILPIFFLAPLVAPAQSTVRDAAVPADTTRRPVLLVFSGSDWCQPCIRFEKQVLRDSAFQTFAANNLKIVEADFPQRKKLPPALRRENEQLAEQYNPEGIFPHLVLLRPDRTVLAVLPTDAEDGPAFIDQIKNRLTQ